MEFNSIIGSLLLYIQIHYRFMGDKSWQEYNDSVLHMF